MQTNESPLRSFLDVAKNAALSAGQRIIELQSRNISVSEKLTKIDLVTEADMASDSILAQALLSAFSEHDVLGEEAVHRDTSADYRWILDPIDGTTNYFKGLHYYSISMALFFRDEPVLGLVYAPAQGELFYAIRGGGAYLEKSGAGQAEPESKPLQLSVSRQRTIEGSLLITGFYYDRGEGMRRTLREIEGLFGKGIMGVRRLGSAALDLCQIAAGRADGFWELILSPWDYSAGALIAMEAGARLSTKEGKNLSWEKSPILAAPSGLWEEMRDFFINLE